MKKIILSLSFAFLLTSLPVKASQQPQIGRNADEGPAIGLVTGAIAMGTGIFFATELYLLRKKVQKLERFPALQQHQLVCEYTKYTNFETMKKDLKDMESTKLQNVGLILGGACALAIGIAKL